MDSKQSPIFTKTSDFILWLLNHTEKFPKSERFRLARRMEDSAFTFYQHLIEAARVRRRTSSSLLVADLELDSLRLYLRLSYARHLTHTDQYRIASTQLVEIGKLLGGWLQSLDRSPAS